MPSQPSAKKIFFYTDSTYFSGAEKSFAILAQTTANHGHSTELLCTPDVAARFKEFVPSELMEASVTRSKLSLAWYRKMRHHLAQEKPDILVVNMWSPYANTLALLAARSAAVPAVSIYHYYQLRSQVAGLLSPLKLWAYDFGQRLVSRILTVSEAHRQVLIDQFGFPEKKVAVLYNGLPSSLSEPQFTDHEPRRLLAVGSLEENKGYEFLLKILAELSAPFTLTVVGDGPERSHLEKLAEKLPGKVRFTGIQSSLDSIYAEHDLLVHPSYFENLSMAILEAMSHGLTVIAQDIGGNRELLSDKEGWLLPLKDQDAWREALTTACTTSLTAKRQAAFQASKRFSAEKQYENFMTFVNQDWHE